MGKRDIGADLPVEEHTDDTKTMEIVKKYLLVKHMLCTKHIIEFE